MTAYRHSSTARAVLRSLVPVICPPEAALLGDAIVEHMALTLGASPANTPSATTSRGRTARPRCSASSHAG